MILKQGGMIYVLIWNPVRIEMGDDWYLVGLNVSRLDGLRVRM